MSLGMGPDCRTTVSSSVNGRTVTVRTCQTSATVFNGQASPWKLGALGHAGAERRRANVTEVRLTTRWATTHRSSRSTGEAGGRYDTGTTAAGGIQGTAAAAGTAVVHVCAQVDTSAVAIGKAARTRARRLSVSCVARVAGAAIAIAIRYAAGIGSALILAGVI